jgi:hypothetical protein
MWDKKDPSSGRWVECEKRTTFNPTEDLKMARSEVLDHGAQNLIGVIRKNEQTGKGRKKYEGGKGRRGKTAVSRYYSMGKNARKC